MPFSREFRILLAEVLLLSFLSLPVLALADYEEDFEDDTPGAAPTEDWYTFSSQGSGSFAATTSVALNSISLRFSKTTATEVVATIDAGAKITKVCDEGTDNGANVKFAFNIVELPNAGVVQLGIYDAPLNAFLTKAYLEISSTGQIIAVARGDSGSESSTAFTTTISAGTWYNATLTMIPCSGAVLRAYLVNQDESVTVNAAGGFSQTSFHHFSVYSPTSSTTVNLRVDNLQFNNMQDPPPVAVGALVTVAVTDLTGFDVDRTGTGALARLTAGDDIQAYAPDSLAPLGAPREVDCDDPGNQFTDMVAATDIGLVYIVCDSGSNNPSFFSIRSLSNGVLSMDGGCDPTDPNDECPDDIDLRSGSECAGGIGDPDFPDDLELKEIGDIVNVPINYAVKPADPPGLGPSRSVAFAYSADNGFIGVIQYTAIDADDDRCVFDRLNFAGSEAEQISVWQPTTQAETTYIAAVDTGGQSKLYHYTPTFGSQPSAYLDGTLQEAGGIGGTSSGTAISCDDYYCLLATTGATDNLRMINLVTGATVWSKTIDEVNRGVALSVRGGLGDNPDGDPDDFAIYLDGTLTSSTAYIVWASNGTAFGSISTPSGQFEELRLRDDGGRAWIATTDVIAVYDIQSAFPLIIPTGCENPPCDEVPDGDGGDGSVLFPVTGLVESGTFANAGLANMFMGVLMVAGMTVTLGFSPQVVTKGRVMVQHHGSPRGVHDVPVQAPSA